MKIIINADDFGLSKSITDGIISSTSLIVNMRYTKYAIKQAIKNGIKNVGLHLNLTVGEPITKNKNLTDNKGVFLYNRKQINRTDLVYEDVYNEINSQIKQFNKFAKGKLVLDHIDTHHHLFDNEVMKRAILQLATENNLPIRKEETSYKNIKTPDILYSTFTINNVDVEHLDKVVKTYRGKNTTVEIMSHPGFIDKYTKKITSYIDREKELNCLEQFVEKNKLKNKLISFREL